MFFFIEGKLHQLSDRLRYGKELKRGQTYFLPARVTQWLFFNLGEKYYQEDLDTFVMKPHPSLEEKLAEMSIPLTENLQRYIRQFQIPVPNAFSKDEDLQDFSPEERQPFYPIWAAMEELQKKRELWLKNYKHLPEVLEDLAWLEVMEAAQEKNFSLFQQKFELFSRIKAMNQESTR